MRISTVLLAGLASRIHSSRIHSTVPKLCKDCKHYIGDNRECRIFNDVDVVTGKVTYDYAKLVRGDEKKCGESATYFEENRFKLITRPYYFLKEYWSIFAIPGILILYIYLLYGV